MFLLCSDEVFGFKIRNEELCHLGFVLFFAFLFCSCFSGFWVCVLSSSDEVFGFGISNKRLSSEFDFVCFVLLFSVFVFVLFFWLPGLCSNGIFGFGISNE